MWLLLSLVFGVVLFCRVLLLIIGVNWCGLRWLWLRLVCMRLGRVPWIGRRLCLMVLWSVILVMVIIIIVSVTVVWCVLLSVLGLCVSVGRRCLSCGLGVSCGLSFILMRFLLFGLRWVRVVLWRLVWVLWLIVLRLLRRL